MRFTKHYRNEYWTRQEPVFVKWRAMMRVVKK
jgi:hypothetical protein